MLASDLRTSTHKTGTAPLHRRSRLARLMAGTAFSAGLAVGAAVYLGMPDAALADCAFSYTYGSQTINPDQVSCTLDIDYSQFPSPGGTVNLTINTAVRLNAGVPFFIGSPGDGPPTNLFITITSGEHPNGFLMSNAGPTYINYAATGAANAGWGQLKMTHSDTLNMVQVNLGDLYVFGSQSSNDPGFITSWGSVTVDRLIVALGGYIYNEPQTSPSFLVRSTLFVGNTGEWNSSRANDLNRISTSGLSVGQGISYIGKDAPAEVTVDAGFNFDTLIVGSGATASVKAGYISGQNLTLGIEGGSADFEISSGFGFELGRLTMGDGSAGSKSTFTMAIGGGYYPVAVWDGQIVAPYGSNGSDHVFNLTSGDLTLVGNPTSNRMPFMNVSSGATFRVYGSASGGMDISGTLSGNGFFGDPLSSAGQVTIRSGGVLDMAGQSSVYGTIDFRSDLILQPGSATYFDIVGAPSDSNTQDRFSVDGDLSTSGTLTIRFNGEYDESYLLIVSTGAVIGGFSDIIVVDNNPGGWGTTNLREITFDVYDEATTAGHLITLVVFDPVQPGLYEFWNGDGHPPTVGGAGGNGTWSAAASNWATDDPNLNLLGRWANGNHAYFGGSAGTVTVDSGSDIQASGMTFSTNNYTFTGGSLELVNSSTGTAPIYVGPNLTAQFGTALTASSVTRVVKSGGGTLELASNDSNFAGGMEIQEGLVKLTGSYSGSYIIPGRFSGAGDLYIEVLANNPVEINGQYNSMTGKVTLSGKNYYGEYILTGSTGSFSGDLDVVDSAWIELNNRDLGGNNINMHSGNIYGNGSIGTYGIGFTDLTGATITVNREFTPHGSVRIVSLGGANLGSIILDIGGSSSSYIDVTNDVGLSNSDLYVYYDGISSLNTDYGYIVVRYGNYYGSFSSVSVIDRGDGSYMPEEDYYIDYNYNNGNQIAVVIYGNIQSTNYYWNGQNTSATQGVQGGNGTWDNSTRNWVESDGSHPSRWVNNKVAIFEGNAGTVTVSSSQNIVAGSLYFDVSGYLIRGASLSLSSNAIISVASGTATISSALYGNSNIDKTGTGELILAASSSIASMDIQQGTLTLGADGIGNGSFSGAITGGGSTTLKIHPSGVSPYILSNDFSAYEGKIVIDGSSTVNITGANSGFAGSTTFTSIPDSYLLVDLMVTGGLGGTVTINSGTLFGPGKIGSSGKLVTLAGGSTLQANSSNAAGTTLNLGGSLLFQSGATAKFFANATGNSDLFSVAENLTLQNGVNITVDIQNLTEGTIIPLFDYGGTLTMSDVANYNLTTGTLPSGLTASLDKDTNGKQVRLVIQGDTSTNALRQYWNGNHGNTNGVLGGDGTWNLTNKNWTNSGGGNTTTWLNGPSIVSYAVFAGTAGGTVTIQSSPTKPVYVAGLDFTQNDYIFTGDPLWSSGSTSISVAPAVTATFDTVLNIGGITLGSGGTLVLTEYSPSVTSVAVSGGSTLQLGDQTHGNGSIGGDIQLASSYLAVVLSGTTPVDFKGSIGNAAPDGGSTFTISATSATSSLNLWANGSLFFTGQTTVSSGVLNGYSDSTVLGGTLNVEGGGLSGQGTFGSTPVSGQSGAVTIGTTAASDLSPGNFTGGMDDANFGTLVIVDALVLGSMATTHFQVVTPNVHGSATDDFITVGGDLTLAGGLVVHVQNDRRGTYYLMSYAGQLSGGFDAAKTKIYVGGILQTMDDYTVNTGNNYVSLTVNSMGTGTPLYWDGKLQTTGSLADVGGDGTWTNSNSANNWTDHAAQSLMGWATDGNAIFTGTKGTVTVDTTSGANGAIVVSGLEFDTDGYELVPTANGGDQLTISSTFGYLYAVVEESGNVSNANITATIGVDITGAGDLIKDGPGKLVMSHDMSFTGQLEILGGTVQIGDGQTDGLAPTLAASQVIIGTDGALYLYPMGTTSTFSTTALGSGDLQIDVGAGKTLDFTADASGLTGDVVLAGGAMNLNSEMHAAYMTVGDADPNYPGTLGAATLTIGLNGSAEIAQGLVVANETAHQADLVLKDGGYILVKGNSGIVLAATDLTQVTVDVTGSGSHIISETAEIIVASGVGSTAKVTISDGGRMMAEAADILIGDQAGSKGTVTVQGLQSRLVALGSIYLAGRLGISDSGGTLNIGSEEGAQGAPAEPGQVSAAKIVFGQPSSQGGYFAELVFNHNATDSQPYVLSVDLETGVLTQDLSDAQLIKHIAGFTTYTGDGSKFNGTTTVSGGTFNLMKSLGGKISVEGGTLSGNATIGSPGQKLVVGSTNASTLNPGDLSKPGTITYGTLTILGDLELASHSTSEFNVGVANAAAGDPSNDLVRVVGPGLGDFGTLTIDTGSKLNVNVWGGVGNYILFTGTVSGTFDRADVTVLLNNVATGVFTLDYSNNAVMLTVKNAPVGTDYYWNGEATLPTPYGAGGNGTWTADTGTQNWTDAGGEDVFPWVYPNTAHFYNGTGTVTVENSALPIQVSGLSFHDKAYLLEPSDDTRMGLTLIGIGADSAVINVDGDDATIGVRIGSSSGLKKTGAGKLILAAANGAVGAFAITDGELQLGDGVNNGTLTGPADSVAVNNGSTLTIVAAGTTTFTSKLTSDRSRSIFNVTGANGAVGTVVFAGDASGYQDDVYIYDGGILELSQKNFSADSITIGEDYSRSAGASNPGGALTLGPNSHLDARTIYISNYSTSAQATLNFGAASGEPAVDAGTIADRSEIFFGDGVAPKLVFNHLSRTVLVDTLLQVDSRGDGNGEIDFISGYTAFEGVDATNALGSIVISGGTLALTADGSSYSQLAVSKLVDVQNGGSLAGWGSIRGDMKIATGGRLLGEQGSGNSSEQLHLSSGSLTFEAGSIFTVALGPTPNATYGLITVDTLVASSSVQVVVTQAQPTSGLAAGEYILIVSTTIIPTAVASAFVPSDPHYSVALDPTNQKLLLVVPVAPPANGQYWHPSATPGTFGGSGTWNVSNTNWTDSSGNTHGAWVNGDTAIFEGNSGTVTVAGGSGIVVGGFDVDGGVNVTLEASSPSDRLMLSPPGLAAEISVGSGANLVFDVVLGQKAGGTPVDILGQGTVELRQASSYTGGTLIYDTATLRLAFDGNVTGGIIVTDGATLEVNASQAVTFGPGKTISQRSNSAASPAAFNIVNGTVQINSNSSQFKGNTTVFEGGTLSGDGGALGGTVEVKQGGTLFNAVSYNTLTAGDTLILDDQSNLDVILDPNNPNTDRALIATGALQITTTGKVAVNINVLYGSVDGLAEGDYLLIEYGTWSVGGLANLSPSTGTMYELTSGSRNGVTGIFLHSDGQGAVRTYWNPDNNASIAQFGGDGTWTAGGGTDWTDRDGLSAGGWTPNAVAVFDGRAGNITVSSAGGAISIFGMEINTDMVFAPAPTGASEITLARSTSNGINVAATKRAQIGVALAGPGDLAKTGEGELVLSAANTFANTHVYAGVLTTTHDQAIPNDIELKSVLGSTPTWNWNVAASGVATSTFAGKIAGDGIFNKQSTRQLELTGNSSAFTGTTNVVAGKLLVNTGASLMGTVNVQSNATLQGTGTFGTINLLAGGTLAAANVGDITTFTNLKSEAGSVIQVRVTYASGTFTASTLAASGTIETGGGTVVLGADVKPPVGVSTTLATVPGYASVDHSDPWVTSGGTPLLAYDIEYPDVGVHETEILLKTVAGAIFEVCALGGNACGAVRGLGSLDYTDPLYLQATGVLEEEVEDLLSQLSGDVYASVNGAMVNNSRYLRDATGAHMREAMGGVSTPNDISAVSNYAAETPVLTPFGPFEEINSGIGVWFTGYGTWSSIDGDGNAAKIKDTAGGMFIGADAAIGAHMRLGALVGYGQSSYEVDARNASGSSDDFTLGLYGGGAWNGFGVDFGAAYTWHDVTLQRQLNFSTFSESLQGDYDAGTFQAYGSLGYTFDITEHFQLAPYADLAYIHQQSGDFSEAGGLSALSHLESEMNTWFTTVGARAAFEFQLGQADSRITASAGWRHGFGDLTPGEQVLFTGGDAFGITGAPLAEDQAVLSAGFETQINEMISVGINYSAQFGGGSTSQNVTGRLNVRF